MGLTMGPRTLTSNAPLKSSRMKHFHPSPVKDAAVPLLAVLLLLATLPTVPGCGRTSGEDDRSANRDSESLAPEPPRAPESYPPGEMAGPLQEAFHLIQSGQYDRAQARIRPYLEEHPNDPMAHFIRGLADHVSQSYAGALPHFERSIELNPEYPPVHHFLGWCLYYLGRPERSEAAFNRHLELDPEEGDSHYALGLLALDAGRTDEAERYFRNAIEYQEHLPHRRDGAANAYAKLGEMRLQVGEPDRAVTYLETAIELYPNHYPAYYQLYRAHLLLDQPDRAQAYLERHDEIRSHRHPVPDLGF